MITTCTWSFYGDRTTGDGQRSWHGTPAHRGSTGLCASPCCGALQEKESKASALEHHSLH